MLNLIIYLKKYLFIRGQFNIFMVLGVGKEYRYILINFKSYQ